MNAPAGLKLRPPRPDDLDRIVAIETACFDDPWPARSLLSELRRDRLRRPLVAESDGGLLGYIMVWRVAVEVHIINLAVAPEARRLGVARRLLDATLADAVDLGCGLATLEVRISNTGAQSFYRRAGFDEVGRRKGYYSDNGEDALILARKIDGQE